MNERYVFHLKEKIEIYNPVFRKTDIIYKNIDKIKYFDIDLKNLTKEEAMFLLKYFSKNGVLDIFI